MTDPKAPVDKKTPLESPADASAALDPDELSDAELASVAGGVGNLGSFGVAVDEDSASDLLEP